MNNKESKKLPKFLMPSTSGLTSIDQLINTTANEIFSFQPTTSREEPLIEYPPSSEKQEEEK